MKLLNQVFAPFFSCALVVFFSLTGCAVSQSPATSSATAMNTSALDSDLRALLTNKPEVINVSALAVKNGQVVYQNQFGRRHIGLTAGQVDLPVTDQTLFRIASISKMVTAIAVMRLVEQGKVNLDADVNTYLGWSFRNPNFADKPITLRMLMTHQASLTDGGESYSFDASVNLRDVLTPTGSRYKVDEHWKKDKAPGTWFEYCNFNWGIIATVLEKATGERFDKLVSRLVLQPMQMKGGFNAADFAASDITNIATQYRKRRTENGKEIWDPAGPWIVQADDFQSAPPTQLKDLDKYVIGTNGTLFGPQGRLRTTVTDLGKLMQMLMNQGRYKDQVILKPETVKALMAKQWQFENNNGDTEGGGSLAWAVGGQIFTDSGKDRMVEPDLKTGLKGFGHLGDAYGLMGTFIFNPETNDGFITFVCGPSVNPETYPARYSALYRWQEQANAAVIKRALLQVNR
jgi:CubicO group peptidase (beta-lactamase class C family)